MANLKKAFSEIYDQNIDRIYRFVYLKVNSREVAEDLASEAFLKCWECFKRGDNIDNHSAFLYQIARNLVIDHYRNKGKAQLISTEDTPVIIDPKDNLEERAFLNSDIEQIKAVLADLKDDYQNVIIWHYLDDLPIQQVAQKLDKSEDNTRVLLHRALKSLREKINKQVKEA